VCKALLILFVISVHIIVAQLLCDCLFYIRSYRDIATSSISNYCVTIFTMMVVAENTNSKTEY